MHNATARYGLIAAALFFVCVGSVPAQNSSPGTPLAKTARPKPTPSQSPLTYTGYVRAFEFDRQNASDSPQNCASVSPLCGSAASGFGRQSFINQQSFNAAFSLHARYAFGSSGWSAAATYVYANALGLDGACGSTQNYAAGGSCQQYAAKSNAYLGTDTSLPAYTLSTLGEAYVAYKGPIVQGTIGDQIFNSPWANASDSRVKPTFYRGIDADWSVSPDWTLGASRMIAWEPRTASAFDQSNLLPNSLASNGSLKTPTSGFVLGKASYANANGLRADVNYYDFYDVASLLWVDGTWLLQPQSPLRFYVGAQYGAERSEGRATEGLIDNQTAGLQIGANVARNLSLSVGFDAMPWRSKDVTAASCAAAEASVNVFLPAGGSGACAARGDGTYRVFYGGIASPYTDSLATDPLYTTSISQGMADRRSAGTSLKLAATLAADHKRVKAVLSQAWYDYSNLAAQNARTTESNLDVTYFFDSVTSGSYHGLSLRERYAVRRIALPSAIAPTAYGGAPLFVYNRLQLEYDF